MRKKASVRDRSTSSASGHEDLMSVRVLLAEGDEVVRRGLRASLEAEADIEIVGEAADGHSAVALLEDLHPNLLVVDLQIDGMNLSTIEDIARRSMKTFVVVYTKEDGDSSVLGALRAGAVGYVLKGSNAAELILAIRRAVKGYRYLGWPFSERAIDVYLERTSRTGVLPRGRLSPREREVVLLASSGLTNSEIAGRLGISRRTAETHIFHIRRKLRAGSHSTAPPGLMPGHRTRQQITKGRQNDNHSSGG